MSFPQELTALRQWICWRLEPDPKGEKPRKVPYDPRTGRKASSTNPETWATLPEAMRAQTKYLFTGVGFVYRGKGAVFSTIFHNPLSQHLANARQRLESFFIRHIDIDEIATVFKGSALDSDDGQKPLLAGEIAAVRPHAQQKQRGNRAQKDPAVHTRHLQFPL